MKAYKIFAIILKLCVWIILFICCPILGDCEDKIVYKEIETMSLDNIVDVPQGWHVTSYAEDRGKDWPKNPPKVCFWRNDKNKPEQCEQIIGYEIIGNFKIIRLHEKIQPKYGVYISANSFGVGGGLNSISVWTYENNSQSFRYVTKNVRGIYSQGEFKFIPSLSKNNERVLVTANRKWEGKEGIWDNHKYIVTVYKYNSDKGYFKSSEYLTRKKYSSEGVIVINPEMKHIIKLLDN